MPKISRWGGPTYEGHEGIVVDALERPSEIDPDHQGRAPLVGEPTEKGADEAYTGDPRAKDDEKDGDDEWAGTSSSTSPESGASTPTPSPVKSRKPARTTGNLSDAGRGASGSAPSTGGAPAK